MSLTILNNRHVTVGAPHLQFVVNAVHEHFSIGMVAVGNQINAGFFIRFGVGGFRCFVCFPFRISNTLCNSIFHPCFDDAFRIPTIAIGRFTGSNQIFGRNNSRVGLRRQIVMTLRTCCCLGRELLEQLFAEELCCDDLATDRLSRIFHVGVAS